MAVFANTCKSHHFEHLLHYPTSIESSRACSTLIFYTLLLLPYPMIMLVEILLEMIALVYVYFSVRLLSVLRDHSFLSSPPQRPTSSDFEGFLSQILSITFFVLSLLFRKSQYFPFLTLSAKQGNYWYHFYNVFGMTRSLTGD